MKFYEELFYEYEKIKNATCLVWLFSSTILKIYFQMHSDLFKYLYIMKRTVFVLAIIYSKSHRLNLYYPAIMRDSLTKSYCSRIALIHLCEADFVKPKPAFPANESK